MDIKREEETLFPLKVVSKSHQGESLSEAEALTVLLSTDLISLRRWMVGAGPDSRNVEADLPPQPNKNYKE